MARKYLAFDIETAKILPPRSGNLLAHRPLGICCAATLAEPDGDPRFWYTRTQDGRPGPRMNKDDAAELVHYLVDMVEKGFTVLTWNGLGFDFDILAEESAMWESCRQLARGHVDMMFHAFCQLGYPIALDSAAAGMRLAGKQETVAAYMAPQLRADGKTDDVLSYVAQDVRATFALALTCEKQRVLKWVSRSGSVRDLALKSGWLSVDQAMSLPEPDTSWMDNRIPRSRFISWLTQRPTA